MNDTTTSLTDYVWDTRLQEIRSKLREMYILSEGKVTLEFGKYLYELKCQYNKGPGNPHGRISFSKVCYEIFGKYPCITSINNRIDDYMEAMGLMSKEESLPTDANESVANKELEEEADTPRDKSFTETKSATEKPLIKKVKVLKFTNLSEPVDGLKTKKLSRKDDGSLVISIVFPEYPNLILEDTFEVERELEPVPQRLLDLFPSIEDRLLSEDVTSIELFNGCGLITDGMKQGGCRQVVGVEWIPPEDKGPRVKHPVNSPEAIRLEEEARADYLQELPAGNEDEPIQEVPELIGMDESKVLEVIGEIEEEKLQGILSASGLTLRQFAWLVKNQNGFADLVANDPELYAKGGLINKDVTKLTQADLLRAGVKPGETTIVEFSSPCQPSSGLNHDRGKYYDPRINLGMYAIRILRWALPQIILMENVPGMLEPVVKAKHDEMIATIEKDYYIIYDVLNPADWGTCQARNRLWWIAIRRDLGIIPSFPLPTVAKENYYTLSEACPHILGTKRTGNHKTKDLFGNTVRAPYPYIPGNRPVAVIPKNGGIDFDYVEDGLQKPRIPDLRTVFDVPKDFLLLGTYRQQAERLGNAVIPTMARVLVEHILAHVRTKQAEQLMELPGSGTMNVA
jgi:site-specific DNA-cytosine methylase